jgi:hypothetical protein
MPEPPRRPRCPFYGFHWPENSHSVYDSGHPECGLDFEQNRNCMMEANGLAPDYDACTEPDRLRSILESCRKDITFYPSELLGRGLSFEDWKRQVMVRKRTA